MDEVAYLIGKTYQTDEIGNQISVSTKRKIYVSVGSVTQYEFYAAAQVGLKPDFRLKTFYLDYQGESALEYQGEIYAVYRTYTDQKAETTELYLTKKVGE
ncbi:MAG: phage head closure protein [Clostridiales bacterium]|jgi:SPP1 family predicted phage head-tail adaptor|nr:phage head closure protein [Clostridiales bacterium]